MTFTAPDGDMSHILNIVTFVIGILQMLRVDHASHAALKSALDSTSYIKALLTGLMNASTERPNNAILDLMLTSNISKTTSEIFNRVYLDCSVKQRVCEKAKLQLDLISALDPETLRPENARNFEALLEKTVMGTLVTEIQERARNTGPQLIEMSNGKEDNDDSDEDILPLRNEREAQEYIKEQTTSDLENQDFYDTPPLSEGNLSETSDQQQIADDEWSQGNCEDKENTPPLPVKEEETETFGQLSTCAFRYKPKGAIPFKEISGNVQPVARSVTSKIKKGTSDCCSKQRPSSASPTRRPNTKSHEQPFNMVPFEERRLQTLPSHHIYDRKSIVHPPGPRYVIEGDLPPNLTHYR